ncbi:MAG: tRNA pseudouridine(55) synthase TruB [Clostridia bacterium]
MMDGFLNLLKPPGMTSSDAVLAVRKMLPRGVKVGHGGTLDPDAAGVLPICVGAGARLFDYIIDKEKEYICELTLGIATDTQDATGLIVEKRPVEVRKEALLALLPGFVGAIDQVPPAYSAIKRDGQRMYALARKGEAPTIEARRVVVNSLDYLSTSGYNRYMLRVVCRKGVYIRTLMHDLGQLLGCGGHMSFLLRSRAGVFTLEDAATLEQMRDAGDMEKLLYPLDAPLGYLPEVRLNEAQRHAVKNGNPIKHEGGLNPGTFVRVYLGEQFAGIGEADGEDRIRFKAMLLK